MTALRCALHPSDTIPNFVVVKDWLNNLSPLNPGGPKKNNDKTPRLRVFVVKAIYSTLI
jgi:hypothetical protein